MPEVYLQGFAEGSIRLPKRSLQFRLLRSVPLFSLTYDPLDPFHGGNTGSNPVGDAILSVICCESSHWLQQGTAFKRNGVVRFSISIDDASATTQISTFSKAPDETSAAR
jgi:hypothetical protein